MMQIISRLHIIAQADAPDWEDIRKTLGLGANQANRGEHVAVSFALTFEEVRPYGKGKAQRGTVTLFQHGYDPRNVLERIEEAGSLARGLTSFANEKPGVSGASGLLRVEMQLFPTEQRDRRAA